MSIMSIIMGYDMILYPSAMYVILEVGTYTVQLGDMILLSDIISYE
jgi:hypothetical protein